MYELFDYKPEIKMHDLQTYFDMDMEELSETLLQLKIVKNELSYLDNSISINLESMKHFNDSKSLILAIEDIEATIVRLDLDMSIFTYSTESITNDPITAIQLSMEAEKNIIEKVYDKAKELIEKAWNGIKKIAFKIANTFINKLEVMEKRLKALENKQEVIIPEKSHIEIKNRFGYLMSVNEGTFNESIFGYINNHTDNITNIDNIKAYSDYVMEFLKYQKNLELDKDLNYEHKLTSIDNGVYFKNVKQYSFSTSAVNSTISEKLKGSKPKYDIEGLRKAFTIVTRVDGKGVTFLAVRTASNKDGLAGWLGDKLSHDFYGKLELKSNSTDKMKIGDIIPTKDLITTYKSTIDMSKNFKSLSKDYYILVDKIHSALKTTKRSEIPSKWLRFYSAMGPKFSTDLMVGTFKLIRDVNWLVGELVDENNESESIDKEKASNEDLFHL